MSDVKLSGFQVDSRLFELVGEQIIALPERCQLLSIDPYVQHDSGERAGSGRFRVWFLMDMKAATVEHKFTLLGGGYVDERLVEDGQGYLGFLNDLVMGPPIVYHLFGPLNLKNKVS